MAAQSPDVSGDRNHARQWVGNCIGIGEPVLNVPQELFQFQVTESDQFFEAEVLLGESFQLKPEHLRIPACVQSKFIVGQSERTLLVVGEVGKYKDRNLG